MEKNTIHMVVTDLDDTLLSKTKEISEEAVHLIEELEKRNVTFTFITGRPPYAVKRFAEKVNITAPIVACNGAMIVNAKTEENLQDKEIPTVDNQVTGEDSQDGETTDGNDPTLKKVKVSDLSAAKDYLADTFGISRTAMRSMKAITEQAAANGIEFEGLS